MGVLLGVPQILELNNNYKNIELIFVFRSYYRTIFKSSLPTIK